ncbi:MAG: sugar phosphate isomerase/epimerase [Chloroflexi bacterium]|nr:sugar phosphate isomerase/epimerase [Chloroflexota bacterium]
MRLGIWGMVPGNPREIDAATVRRIRDWGFSGVAVAFNEDHHGIDAALCHQIKTLFADGGVEPVQLGAWMAPVINRDPDKMAWAADQRREVIRVASAIGFRSVSFGSGTLSPRGESGFGCGMKAWYPDRRNYGQEAFDLTVGGLKEMASVAEDYGIYVSLECQMFSVLSSPERTRAVIDAVGSPRVKLTIDPINWLGPREYFDSGATIERMFDVLGQRILDAHAKDVKLEDHVNVHMPETYVGNGGLDFVTLLRRLDAHGAQRAHRPEVYLIIEHAPLDLIPKARENLLAFACEAGVTFEC